MSITYYSAPGVREIDRLPSILSPERQEKEARRILYIVAKFHAITIEEMCRRGRNSNRVLARQQFCYLVWKKVKGITYQKIADILNATGDNPSNPLNYDHSDVIHCKDKVLEQLSSKSENPHQLDITNLLLIL